MHIAQYVSGFLSVLLFVVKAHFVKQMKVQVCLEMCGGPCNGDLSAQLGPPVSHRIEPLGAKLQVLRFCGTKYFYG